MREDDILSSLNKYFRYEALRPGQLTIINKVLENRDVIVCKESGFGKSLCFQLPGMMREGLVVVFSNLMSRVKQKCQELSLLKVKCTHSITHAKDLRNFIKSKNKFWDDLHCIKTSRLKFLYVTLDYFKDSARLREALEDIYRKNMLQAIVIDEINYTSQWIDSFKCDYSELGSLRDAYPDTPFLCFIGPTSQDKFCLIKDTLHLQNPFMLNEPSTVVNVSHQVMYIDENISPSRLVQFIKESYHGQSGIVYCFDKEYCNILVNILKRNDVSSIFYADDLNDCQKKWITQRNKYGIVIVCLSGMPLDFNLKKIDFTIHMRIPIALDIYIAETSKVGQNGTPTNSVVLYSKEDSQYHLDLITNPYKEKISKTDPETKDLLLTELKDYRQELFGMTLFTENQSICRQVFMLKYLNDENIVEPCGICDVCRVMEESFVVDMSNCLKKILSAIWIINRHQRGVKSEDYVFASITFLIDLLLGHSEESMKRLNVQLCDELIFGSFGSWNANTLHTLIIVLLIQKFASINLVANDEFAVYQNLIITAKGRQFVNSTNEFGIPFSCKDVKITKWLNIDYVKRQLVNDLKAIVNYNLKHYNLNIYDYEKYCIQLSTHVPGTREEFQRIKVQYHKSNFTDLDEDLFNCCLMYRRILKSLQNGIKDNKATYKTGPEIRVAVSGRF